VWIVWDVDAQMAVRIHTDNSPEMTHLSVCICTDNNTNHLIDHFIVCCPFLWERLYLCALLNLINSEHQTVIESVLFLDLELIPYH